MAKQKSGLYRTKVTVGHDADGKPIVKYISGKTKKELEEARQEILRTYSMAAADTRREILFSDYAEEWYEVYKKPHIGKGSIGGYNAALNRILPVFKDRQLRAISAADLQRFMNSMSDMSKSSIGYAGTILRNVFSLAYANGLIERDPAAALKNPSAEKESKRALTDAETSAVLFVGKEHPEGLLLLVLYYTGLRRGEALGLQWKDINFSDRTITVERDIDYATNSIGDLKTKYSYRVIPLPDPLAAVLWPLRGFPSAFLFPAPKSGSFLPQRTFFRRWDRLMKAVLDENARQISDDPTVEPIETEDGLPVLTAHYFRHNYASVLYNAGVDILAAQRYLGHADVKTTLAIYAHLSKGREHEAADKVRSAFAASN
ncbi:MAG: site-specific integrase [Christensenellaceae bacterium]|nr:site-specific integrase [Christensenellaceae bacterium]